MQHSVKAYLALLVKCFWGEFWTACQVNAVEYLRRFKSETSFNRTKLIAYKIKHLIDFYVMNKPKETFSINFYLAKAIFYKIYFWVFETISFYFI